MNPQFKVFLKHFADENRQRTYVPRLKEIRRTEYNRNIIYDNSIRSGGSGTSYLQTQPGICPNEVAKAMKSLSQMMGVNIK